MLVRKLKSSDTGTKMTTSRRSPGPCSKSVSCANDSAVVVRPWRPGDEKGTWEVLKDGSLSNVSISYLLVLKKRATTFAVCIFGSMVLGYTRNVVSALVSVAVTLCILYFIMWLLAVIYLYGPPMWDMKNVLKSYFTDNDSCFWVAESSGNIVGTIAIVKQTEGKCGHQKRCIQDGVPGKVAWLRRMAVLRECRGQGIARLLVNKAVEFCKSRNYDKIELITTQVHQSARRLYDRSGFTCTAFQPHRYWNGLVKIWTYEYVLQLKNSVIYEVNKKAL